MAGTNWVGCASNPREGRVKRSIIAAIIGLACLPLLDVAALAAGQAKPVMVFAAASLKNALDEIEIAWMRETGKKATIVYAASNMLAKQIEAGAPADLFVSADLDWMEYAASTKQIRPESRVNLLGNSLVLIARNDSKIAALSGSPPDLSSLLGSQHLAMGNVDAVPAGKYGKAALETLRQWDGVKDRIAQGESVRAALLLVSRGEAPLGIVYRSDAVADPGVRIVYTFPADTHPAIVYPAALTADSTNSDAPAFLAYLSSPTAKTIFEQQGFVPLSQRLLKS
jgi:molybdate transport system substrate-binding protein